MAGSGTGLFAEVQARIAQGHERVDEFTEASEELRAAAHLRLRRLERASRTDLSVASRAVESFHADLDAGELPFYE